MLAWQPEFQAAYDLELTIWSIALAVAGSWAGIAVALTGKLTERTGAAAGGAIIGVAMAAMHYTGMAAVRMPAIIHQDRLVMAASVIIAVGLSVAAFRIAIQPGFRERLTATAAFAAGICGLHFTGMAGVSLVPDPMLNLPQHVIAPTSLAVATAAVTIMIVGFGLAGSIINQHLASRAQREAARLRSYITELEATQRELKATTAELTSALETTAAANQEDVPVDVANQR